MRARRVPLRTCVICGKKTGKRDLLRIVAAPDGEVSVDRTGRMNGRGAYVCTETGDCPDGNLRRERVERALRTSISSAAWNDLAARAASERRIPVQ